MMPRCGSIREQVQALAENLRSATSILSEIQQALSLAAIQSAGDPLVLEALKQLEHGGELRLLKHATDQMRQFLWFYRRAIHPDPVSHSCSQHSSQLAALLQVPGFFDSDGDGDADFDSADENEADFDDDTQFELELDEASIGHNKGENDKNSNSTHSTKPNPNSHHIAKATGVTATQLDQSNTGNDPDFLDRITQAAGFALRNYLIHGKTQKPN